MKKNHRILGVLAALGISLTAAVGFPLVNVLDEFSTAELMIARGSVTAIFFALIFRNRITVPSRDTLFFSILFGLANLSLYQAIRTWGANPTIVILTLTPIVNFGFKSYRGDRIDTTAAVSLVFMLLGVVITLQPWNTAPNFWGYFWSLSGVVLAGTGFEVLSKTGKLDPFNRTLWLGVVIGVVGLSVHMVQGEIPFKEHAITQVLLVNLIGFGMVAGFLYLLSIVLTFDYLETEVASVLAMAETPAVIIGAQLLLGETMGMIEWGGVILALVAATALALSQIQKEKGVS